MNSYDFQVAGLVARRERLRCELAAVETAITKVATTPRAVQISDFIHEVLSENPRLSSDEFIVNWTHGVASGGVTFNADMTGSINVTFINGTRVVIPLEGRSLGRAWEMFSV